MIRSLILFGVCISHFYSTVSFSQDPVNLKTRTNGLLLAAEGANGAGNGGDAAVCFHDPKVKNKVQKIIDKNRNNSFDIDQDPLADVSDIEILSVNFLDLDQRSRLARDVISWNGIAKPMEIIASRLKLIKSHYYSDFYGLIQYVMERFPFDRWIPSESGVFREIDDSRHYSFPGNDSSRCLTIQLAIQTRSVEQGKSPSLTDHIQIEFNSRLYRLMGNAKYRGNPIHQASLMFHEWLYFIAVVRGHTDSVRIREFVGYVFSDEFEMADSYDRIEKFRIEMDRAGLSKIDPARFPKKFREEYFFSRDPGRAVCVDDRKSGPYFTCACGLTETIRGREAFVTYLEQVAEMSWGKCYEACSFYGLEGGIVEVLSGLSKEFACRYSGPLYKDNWNGVSCPPNSIPIGDIRYSDHVRQKTPNVSCCTRSRKRLCQAI